MKAYGVVNRYIKVNTKEPIVPEVSGSFRTKSCDPKE